MKTKEDLRTLLRSIDHRGYPAYKDTRGVWRFDLHILSIDRVQGDPFASPSNLSLTVPGKTAGFPPEYYENEHRRTALEDHLLRLFSRAAAYGEPRTEETPEKQENGRGDFRGGGRGRRAGSGKSGLIATTRPGQEVLPRTACRVNPENGDVTVRFEAGFPAAGRTILADELIHMLFDIVPKTVQQTLLHRNIDRRRLREAIGLSDDIAYIREKLPELGLAAFVADGSCLPRRSGVSQLPMKDAVRFKSPDSMAVTLQLPHRGPLRGMGIKKGITLIVGGGYHGKSTLLTALERGIYSHIAGDGREYVITDGSAMKIRAEDGRCVRDKDISLFINNLPNGKDTVRFRTEDASGSTSQAANVSEAMEAGAGTLLIDEDTSATNFMVRDELMAEIVLAEKEPITPFISRIRDLYDVSGISTILVAGSSGAYFHVADTVIQMDRYVPHDITEKIRLALSDRTAPASPAVFRAPGYREPDTSAPFRHSPGLRRDPRLKIKVLSEDAFLLGHEEVDLRGLEQIADRGQTQALAYVLKYMELHILDGKKTLKEAVREMTALMEKSGPEVLFDGSCVRCGLSWIRPQEIFGTLNRYRG